MPTTSEWVIKSSVSQYMALNAACFALAASAIATFEYVGTLHIRQWWLICLIGLSGYLAGRVGFYWWAAFRHYPMISRLEWKRIYAGQWAETSRLNRILFLMPSTGLIALIISDVFSNGPIWNLANVHFITIYSALSASILPAFFSGIAGSKTPPESA